MNTTTPVRFSKANSKLSKLYKVRALARFLKNGRKVYSLDLLAGVSCPGANICKSHVVETANGVRYVVDGKGTIIRCFSASQEALRKNVFNLRKRNYSAVRGKSREEILSILTESLPVDAGIIRAHVSGDFFSQAYFLAWCDLAKMRPDILIYAYTKSLRIVLANVDAIPDNLRLTLSAGGVYDKLIPQLPQYPVATIVYSAQHARELGLPIDSDDSHAALCRESFALIVHGTQPAGSEAARAVAAQRAK